MVNIFNNYIIISKDDPCVLPIMANLKIYQRESNFIVKGRKVSNPAQVYPLYEEQENEIVLRRGLLNFVKEYFVNSEVNVCEVIESPLFNTKEYTDNIELIRNILPSYPLRDLQLDAVKQALLRRKCIIQSPTGSGKSAIMCAIIKVLTEVNNGICPTVIVLEPTQRLKDEMIEGFRNNGVPAVDYSRSRTVLNNHVNISHPTSMINDLRKDKLLLSNVDVILGDECHHGKSNSYQIVRDNCMNAVYAIGLSASAVLDTHINLKDITKFTISEAKTLSTFGPLAFTAKAEDLIEIKSLASPVLCLLKNEANEKFKRVSDEFSWIEVSRVRLQSEKRTNLVAMASAFFCNQDRKSLILVHTREWAQRILMKLYEMGLGNVSRISFGGGEFQKCINGICERDISDVFSQYKSGEIKILIGTGHLVEGVDVPSLDALILAYGGKSERIQLQSIGRVLRITKTGKKAWIVDFTDEGDKILFSQVKHRIIRYQNIIGIKDEDIHYCENIRQLKEVFNKYEKD